MNKTVQLILALTVWQGVAFAAPIPVTGTGSYSQNFDSLGAASVPWVNDSTITGWFAQINNGTTVTGSAQASDGNGTVFSGLLNLGPAGGAERALGSKATGTGNFANIAYAVQFQNTSSKPVALSQLDYTGELWRSNSGATTPEQFDVFYAISSAPLTNILSGTSSAAGAPGAGFTAIPAAAWSLSNAGAAVALDGNDPANRLAVSTSLSGVTLAPGQYLTVKWTDANEANTDGYQGIDDVTLQFTELNGLLVPAVSTWTRNANGTPSDPADDTFGFTVNVAGSGTSIGSGWTTGDVSAPNAAAANYGTPVVWTGFPVAAPKFVTFSDVGTPAFTASIAVDAPRIIGLHDVVGAVSPILYTNGAATNGWVIDETARTLTQNSSTQGGFVIDTGEIDISGLGFVRVQADLDAIAGTSSGFEAPDSFTIQAIIDGGAPVSILGANDVNNDGVLTGGPAGSGSELPDAGITNLSKPFSFDFIVPATANTLQIRIIGNSNSPSETYVVKNLRLSDPPPTLFTAAAGPVTVDNKGTVDPSDDEFSGPVNLTAVNLSVSTGWTSNGLPTGGSYSTPNPVIFGPFLVSAGARTVTVTDIGNPAVTTSFTLTPPVPTLTVSAVTNIVRNEGLTPGIDDDTISFDVTITGTSGGPTWTTSSGVTPASGSFGTQTFTVPASTTSPLALVITDSSYPAATQTVNVALPGRYTIGWTYFGGVLGDVNTLPGTPPATQWTNDTALRSLSMINGGGGADKVVVSDVIDLSAQGTVYFSAQFRALETSNGSNFETTDKFKAELIIDGGLVPADIINLVSSYDAGDGASATAVATVGANGPADGYINGYLGIAGVDQITTIDYSVAPFTAEDEYNANRVRDEFNRRGEIADISINNVFALSGTIPAGANSVQLRISGVNDAGSEFFTVSEVVFSSVPPTADTDGDGVTDLRELADGTNPNNPNSIFTVTGITTGTGGEQITAFSTAAGRLYRGYFSTDLVTWTRDDTSPSVAGDGTEKSWTLPVLPAPGTRHYLRVLGGSAETDFPATLP